MQSQDEYQNLWKRIHHVRYGMLTTLDPDGMIRARPMTTVQKEFDGSLWFFTSKSSVPAIAIEDRDQVGVQYADMDADFYASLTGTAILTRDQQKIEELWNPMVAAWFPEGVDDPDLTLIRIDVDEAEYWDVKGSKASQIIKMVKAAVTHQRPDNIAKHGKLNY